MKKLIKALTLGAVVLGASAAYAIPSSGSVYIEETAYAADYGGGEFLAAANGGDPFFTFCVEREKALTSLLPSTFSYTIADSASSTLNVLSEGTVYLYRAFLSGSLYDLGGADRKDNSIALQLAIWTLEGEGGGFGQNVGNNAFLAMAANAFTDLNGAMQDSTDKTVRVMRIWGSDREDLQDVLVYVPDTGSSLMLLGLGLAALAAARRKFNA